MGGVWIVDSYPTVTRHTCTKRLGNPENFFPAPETLEKLFV